MSFKRNRRNQTCAVTRNPTAGQSGVSVIDASLPCTPPYPANKQNWELATEFEAFEIYTQFNESIKSGMTLTHDSVSYRIKRTKQWPPRPPRTGYTLLLLEKYNG